MLVISLVMRRNQQEAIRVEWENNARLETVNTDMKKTKRIVRDRWKKSDCRHSACGHLSSHPVRV